MPDDLTTLQAEVTAAEARIARLEAELTGLERELDEFRARYDQVVSPVSARLEAVKAAVAELEDQRRQEMFANATPLESWTQPGEYVPVEEQYRRIWGSPSPSPETITVSSPPEPDSEASLKRLYRDLARRYHPDFARNDADRDKRTRLMALINEAYDRRDPSALRALAELGEDAPADVPLVILQTDHLRRRRDDLLRRIDNLEAERAHLLNREFMKLKVDEKIARLQGRNLLAELAAALDAEYWEWVARLESLRRA
jgi:hypothetical protein